MTTPTEHENGPETAAHEPTGTSNTAIGSAATGALLPESAYVCVACGNLWTERRPEDDDPQRCEWCRHTNLRVFPLRIVGNMEAAEEESENIIAHNSRRDEPHGL